uniref:Transmembrane protein n=1 Tax=Rodentolepis nana TaxID=102285 RepID=A0A0R3TB87_RODNA
LSLIRGDGSCGSIFPQDFNMSGLDLSLGFGIFSFALFKLSFTHYSHGDISQTLLSNHFLIQFVISGVPLIGVLNGDYERFTRFIREMEHKCTNTSTNSKVNEAKIGDLNEELEEEEEEEGVC